MESKQVIVTLNWLDNNDLSHLQAKNTSKFEKALDTWKISR